MSCCAFLEIIPRHSHTHKPHTNGTTSVSSHKKSLIYTRFSNFRIRPSVDVVSGPDLPGEGTSGPETTSTDGLIRKIENRVYMSDFSCEETKVCMDS